MLTMSHYFIQHLCSVKQINVTNRVEKHRKQYDRIYVLIMPCYRNTLGARQIGFGLLVYKKNCCGLHIIQILLIICAGIKAFQPQARHRLENTRGLLLFDKCLCRGSHCKCHVPQDFDTYLLILQWLLRQPDGKPFREILMNNPSRIFMLTKKVSQHGTNGFFASNSLG